LIRCNPDPVRSRSNSDTKPAFLLHLFRMYCPALALLEKAKDTIAVPYTVWLEMEVGSTRQYKCMHVRHSDRSIK
jgi:hypothetical protein